jgi:enoyl-CoA hydratase
VDRHDAGVVLLTLALPDKRNAMTAELTAQWGETVASLAGDRSVRCVVVTGAARRSAPAAT